MATYNYPSTRLVAIILVLVIIFSIGTAIAYTGLPTGFSVAKLIDKLSLDSPPQDISKTIAEETAPSAAGSFDTMLLFVGLVESYYNSDVITMARKVTQIDAEVQAHTDVAGTWKQITACLTSNCDKSSVYTFSMQAIETLAKEQSKSQRSQLILNSLAADGLWGDKDLVSFSKALDSANAIVVSLNNPQVSETWTKYIQCAGKCANSKELMFNFLKSVLNT